MKKNKVCLNEIYTNIILKIAYFFNKPFIIALFKITIEILLKLNHRE